MAAASIHATAVAIDGEALLICGPSRSGKSRLAVALIACSTSRQPIALIGDDRILLSEKAGGLVARPHPRIAGFIERRGLGIVAMDWVVEAPVGGLVELGVDGEAAAPPSPACGRRRRDEVGPDEAQPRFGGLCQRGGMAPHPTSLHAGTFSRKRERLRSLPRLVLTLAEADADRVLAWWSAAARQPHHTLPD